MTRRSMEQSSRWFERARRRIPGGVNSPVRAFKAVGGNPLFIADARGACLRDVDGNEYIDYIGSWGPMILGHGHPEVVEAVRRQLDAGFSYGAPTCLEVEMAEEIARHLPSIEVVRMVNSGTEATMSVVRVARGATGRDAIIKFEGCYHGHADAFLSKAGSGAATLGVPDSPGVPAAMAATTFNARYNDLDSVRAIFEGHPGRVAAILLEPVVGNMGTVPPKPGFLAGLRMLADQYGALLIFDEVMTGFRVALGGAQTLYGVRPDLTALGKIIGGGLPVGAYGGRRDLMALVAPEGPVYQAGTLSGNPLAMTAGLTTLRILARDAADLYARLEALGALLQEGLEAIIRREGYPLTVGRVGSMATLFFRAGAVENWDDASGCDRARHGVFFHAMLDQGIYLPPSQFEAMFLSAAHTREDMDRTLDAARVALSKTFQ